MSSTSGKNPGDEPADVFGFVFEKDKKPAANGSTEPTVGATYATNGSVAGVSAEGDVTVNGERVSTGGKSSRSSKSSGGGSSRGQVKQSKPPKVKGEKKGGRRRSVAILLILAVVAGGVAYKQGLFKKPEASSVPQTVAPKGWQCKKWTPPGPATSLVGKAKQPVATGKLKARQEAMAGAVKTMMAVAGKAAPSTAVVTGCGPNQITMAASGSVGDQKANTTTVLYDLASATKPFTATAALMLADEGKLKLTDKVGKYLPQWQTPTKKNVTVLQLMQHTSGLPGEDEDDLLAEYAGVIGSETSAEVIEANVANVPLDHKPGQFQYSNLGYVTLYLVLNKALALHKTADGKMNRYLRAKLFEPLGMKNTMYTPDPKSRLCAPTHPFENTKATLTCQARDLLVRKTGGVTGHAGLFSTASDMSRFAAMLASGGQLDGKRYLTAADLKLMRSAVSASQYGYSTGVWTNKVGRWGKQMGRLAFGGYGDTGAAFSVDPITGYWAVFLNNASPDDGKVGKAKEGVVKTAIKKVNDLTIATANKTP